MSWTGRFGRWAKRNELRLVTGLLVFLFLVAYLSPRIFIAVHAGRAGVLWSRFGGGTQTDRIYGEGMHVLFPWNVFAIYDMRLLQVQSTYDVLTADGLPIKAVVSIRYKLIPGELGYLHKYVGPSYVETLLLPKVGGRARQVIAQYTPEQLYSTRRREIESAILRETSKDLPTRLLFGGAHRRFLHLEDILIRSVRLPPQLEQSIMNKLSQQQQVLEYDYRLLKETKEAQRKEIEARGIRRFQDVVSEGISDRYLKWKGIDATVELARSQNSKIVVIGGKGDGLPLILNGLETTDTRAASKAPNVPNVPKSPGQ